MPIILFYLNYRRSVELKKKTFIPCIFIILLSLLLADFFHYLSWGITTGHFYNPDFGTKVLFFYVTVISFISVLIIGIILQIIIVVVLKKEQDAD
jgi:uncharacterized membrane protein